MFACFCFAKGLTPENRGRSWDHSSIVHLAMEENTSLNSLKGKNKKIEVCSSRCKNQEGF